MPLYNRTLKILSDEKEKPGAALERAKDIGKSAIKFLGPDPDSPTFVQEVGQELIEFAVTGSPYKYVGSQILQNVPAVKAGKEVLSKTYSTILDTAFSPIKRVGQTWDDFLYMTGGGVGTGTGVGGGGRNINKKFGSGSQQPANIPEWEDAARKSQWPRTEIVKTKPDIPPPRTGDYDPKWDDIPLNEDISANVNRMRIFTDLGNLKPQQQFDFRKEIKNFLNQANEYAKKQIKEGNIHKPLDGFEYVNLAGENTGGRQLIDPLGRVWTVRRPKESKGWQFKNYADLDTYRETRLRYDLTSSADEALARKRSDAYKVQQNKALKERRNRLLSKGTDLTEAEKQWLKDNEFIEFYGEHIRRLSRGNPIWRIPRVLKGTMKSGDVANYKIFSNQIEKKFKDKVETVLYGKTSGKHYGAHYGKTGNELTLGMTNDFSELTIEEILPNGDLKQLGTIPLLKAYDDSISVKTILNEIIGPPAPVIKFSYKPVGNKEIPVRKKSWLEIIEEAFNKNEGPFSDLTKTNTILKKTKYLNKP